MNFAYRRARHLATRRVWAAANKIRREIVTYVLTNDAWLSACLRSRLSGDDDPLDALRGITLGSLLSMLMFWMPVAIALTR